jgi:hypothetical protein
MRRNLKTKKSRPRRAAPHRREQSRQQKLIFLFLSPLYT